MQLVKAIIRPDKVESVKEALTAIHISGMTIVEVRGRGHQRSRTATYRGREYEVALLPKMQIETLVPDELVERVVEAIIDAARTGEVGDGRVFVLPVARTYRIRTGEAA